MNSPGPQRPCYSKPNFALFLSARELGLVGGFGRPPQDLDHHHRKEQRPPVCAELWHGQLPGLVLPRPRRDTLLVLPVAG